MDVEAARYENDLHKAFCKTEKCEKCQDEFRAIQVPKDTDFEKAVIGSLQNGFQVLSALNLVAFNVEPDQKIFKAI